MATQCLIAEFANRRELQTAIDVLEKSHFTSDEVSVVSRADQVEHSIVADATDTNAAKPPDEKTTAAATLAGGTLGAVFGAATLMGPMLVAGPIIGMAAGAVGGGLLSAVERFGVQEDVSQQYESKVASGASLVIVTGDEIKINNATQALQTCGPQSLETFKA